MSAEASKENSPIKADKPEKPLFTEREEALFEALRAPAHVEALSAAAAGDVGPVLDAAELAVTLRRTRAGHLATLRDGLDARLPLLYVPYLFTRSHGARATRRVAELLAEEL